MDKKGDLFAMCGPGQLEVLQTMIRRFPNFSYSTNTQGNQQHSACIFGEQETCRYQISVNVDIDCARDSDEATPQHIACKSEHYDIVEFLLQSKANPNMKNTDDETPLMIAVNLQSEELIGSQLKARANPNQHSNDDVYSSPLMKAYNDGLHEVTLKLLASEDIIVRREFLWQCCCENNTQIACIAIAKAEITELDENYRHQSPFLKACAWGNIPIIEVFLKYCPGYLKLKTDQTTAILNLMKTPEDNELELDLFDFEIETRGEDRIDVVLDTILGLQEWQMSKNKYK